MRIRMLAVGLAIVAIGAAPAAAAPSIEIAPCGSPPRPGYVVSMPIGSGMCVFIYAG